MSLRDGNAVGAIQKNSIAFNLSLREFCVAKFVAIYEYKIHRHSNPYHCEELFYSDEAIQ
ncbi:MULTISPECIES: hypothetical protein [unclassified Campylobacter]|nr:MULTISPECIES: hypothetical protein [unclassified Campylobacter]MDA3043651.1 hypothetical protein [Campylobacter sp. JMF_09 ED2]MDA3072466.1 hypothetical protein [Campylobacter sp. VBCF_03 NA9]MDA3077216.1 hypothetical protein [Campylobacter sp. JMF_04 NA10]